MSKSSFIGNMVMDFGQTGRNIGRTACDSGQSVGGAVIFSCDGFPGAGRTGFLGDRPGSVDAIKE